MLKIESVRAEIKSVNPRKEKGEDGEVLASDVSMEFTVPRGTINKLFAGNAFMDQFFSEEQGATLFEMLYPLVYSKRVEDLHLTIAFDGGESTLEFAPVRTAKNMKLEPTFGGYVVVSCKFQVYPTADESGMLDMYVHESVDIQVTPLNVDLEDDDE